MSIPSALGRVLVTSIAWMTLGCGGPALPAPAREPPVSRPSAAASPPQAGCPKASPTTAADQAALARVEAGMDAIFTATVIGLGPEPRFVSGDVPATQEVTVRIDAVRKGALAAGDEVRVDVVVVGCGTFVLAGPGGLPALDPGAVRPGRRLAFSAQRVGSRFRAWHVAG